jgi:GNAT superfamily N-acetyltransferase
MGDEFQIRRATSADLALIMRHRTEIFREMGFLKDELAAMGIHAEPYFAGGLVNGDYHGWLFEDGSGRVVAGGGVSLITYPPSPRDLTPRRPWIFNVYTEPAYRHRGLARRLMEAMIDWCRAQGYQSINLHATQFGRRLYQSLGFEQTNEMRLRLK